MTSTSAAVRRLEGKVAIVTGAANGIGQAIAQLFQAHGATVAGYDLGAPASGEDTFALFGQGDVADAAAVSAFVAQVAEGFGRVDVLVSNAGSVVNIASVHGHRIIQGAFPYNVAKHALIGMTKALGLEYAARGIRFNSISPGLILVDRIERWFDAQPDPAAARREQEALLPPQRIGEPSEVAQTALFLASDEARFINATDVLIDGGRSQVYY